MDGQFQTSGEGDPAPAEWLTAALRRHFDEIMRQRDKVIEPSNADAVHDMRVAIRRFRGLLGDLPGLLEIPELRSLRKKLKIEAQLLGKVRDQDVFGDSLRVLAGANNNVKFRSDIQLLIDECINAREHAFRRLEAKLSKHSPKLLADRFSSAIEAISRKPHVFSADDVKKIGREVVSARLRELSKLGDSIYDPFDKRGLHKVRIAAKRLRYSAELFEPVIGPSAQVVAAEASRMQSLLGDVHDRDLWTARLSKSLKHRGHSAALHHVFSKVVKKRSSRYRSALKLWSGWRTDDFLDRSVAGFNSRLEDTVSTENDSAS